MQRLNPTRYILTTSVDLTVSSKQKLMDALPHVQSPDDLIGAGQIHAFLEANPDIVRRHIRLWLNSAAILRAMFGQRILVRSAALRQEIDECLRTYCPTPSHTEVLEILENRHVCIIAGIPGIGKTTIAQAICAEYIAEGYEVIEISSDTEEVNEVWDDDVAQLFYYDDFLGQTTLEDKLQKNEDSRLISLLRRVYRSPNKRFVLTTREYILEQARRRYEKIDREDFAPIKCVVDVSRYNRLARASVLYNHLFHSELTPEELSSFTRAASWRAIIDHAGFNPRLVSLSIQQWRTRSRDGKTAAEHVKANLDSPKRLWGHIVEYQLEETDVDLLRLLFSFGDAAPVERILKAWLVFSGKDSTEKQALRSLSILEGTFIKTSRPTSSVIVEFHNPSVRDFMRELVSEDPDTVRRLIETATYFEQLHSLWTSSKAPTASAWPTMKEAMRDLWRESDLSRTLSSAAEAFGARAAELLEFENHGFSQHRLEMPPRLITCIKFLEEHDHDDLTQAVTHSLESSELFDFCQDGDSVVRLTRLLHDTHWTGGYMPDLKEYVRQGAINWITQDTSGWRNLTYAESLLEELGELGSSELGDLRSQMDDVARDYLERFDYPDSDRRIDRSDLQEIVEYASAVDVANPDYYYPGLDAARYELSRINAETDGGHPVIPRPEGLASTPANDSEIQEMMDSLAWTERSITGDDYNR